MRHSPVRRRWVAAIFLGAILVAVELVSRAGLSVLERRGVEYRPLVADRDAYPEALARLDFGLEFENFGVPAYGLDQAFLRYQREGRRTHPRILVIGFLSENLYRDVSVFRLLSD